MTIRGVGFDLGETLIFYRDTPLSWASLYRDALRSVADACHVSPTADQFVEAEKILSRHNTRIVPRTHEVSAEEILSAVLRSWRMDPEPHLITAIDAFFTFFQQRMAAYPDAVTVLSALRKQGMRIGILTDVPYGMPRNFVQRDLDGAGILRLFDVLLTSVEVGVRKPEVVGFVELANRLGVIPGEMLYIGNEPKDIMGASRAGLTAVFLDRDGKGGSYGQQFTISTLASLPDLIAGYRTAS